MVDGQTHGARAAGAAVPGAPRRLALLVLAPLAIFVWQFAVTHAILGNPSGSMGAYYYGRCLLALPVAFVCLRRPSALSGRAGAALSVGLACVAVGAPSLLTFAPCAPAPAYGVCLAAGAASTWLYMGVFLAFSRLAVRDALTLLLGALVLSYPCRMALGFASDAALAVVGLVAPFACVGVLRLLAPVPVAAPAAPVRERAELAHRQGGDGGSYGLAVAEFAVCGFVAGLVRTPYEAAQFDLLVNVGGGALLATGTAALLVWARAGRAARGLGSVLQVILLLLLTVLLVLVVFGSAGPAVAAVASLFARFGVYTLLLYVLCVFVARSDAHPYATFGLGWGCFSLATGLGMTLAAATGISRLSATLALGIVYVLVAVTLAVYARVRKDDVLFSEGAPSELVPQGPAQAKGDGVGNGSPTASLPGLRADQTLGDIVRRCAQVGEDRGLTHREVEVIQLICLGRSKSYIAESFSVTENTVRGYAKNAYRKLDIHSRQELLTLVGMA